MTTIILQKKIVPILKAAGVKRAALFGSVARGEAGPESDIDILLDMPDNASLFDLVHLENELKDKLGRDVDLVTYRALHPRIRDRVLAEQKKII
ncbi:MAG: nucleotidyltransferase family protein [Patescibacteria group bacterium]